MPVLIYPNPPVFFPPGAVWLAKALFDVGFDVRFRTLLNSARIFILMRSRMRNVRPKFRFSVGRR